MDYSQLSTADLQALQRGDLSAVSTAGLHALQGESSAPAPAPSYLEQVKANMLGTGQAFNQLLMGGLRGAAGIGATLQHALNPAEWGNAQADKDRRASIDDFFRENSDPNSFAFGQGKLGAEVAGTMGVGGALGNVAKFAGASAPIVDALSSAGFTAGARTPGVLPALANMGTRVAGGAATGAASTALVSPADALGGAVVGGALPPAIALMGKSGAIAADMWRKMVSSGDAAGAAALVKALDAATPADRAAIVANLRAAPTLVDGASPTVAQALQTPQASILQRVVYDSPGGSALRNKVVAQNQARIAALEGVAATDPTGLAMARESLGQSITRQVMPERDAAMQRVRELYDSVDPAGEIRLQLPLDEFAAARDKFLGPGTFGQGKATAQALKTAQDIGTETTDAVVTKMGQPAAIEATLGRAVRRVGIDPAELGNQSGYAGEVRYLKQSGFGKNLVNKNGQSLEQVAERMHADGYLDAPDAHELITKLTEEASGSPVFSRYGDASRMAANKSAPDLRVTPGTSTPVALDWPTLQNFRSSLGDAAAQADSQGLTRASAALNAMRSAISGRVDEAAAIGALKPGESFPQDAYARWLDANAAHGDRIDRFDTGPLAGIFRTGPNGEPALQGGEIAARAWGARPGLADDVQAFRRLIADNPQTLGQFRSMVTTEGAGTADAAGNLTTKFSKWVRNTLPGLRETFSPEQVTTLERIAQDIDRQASAAKLGTSLGGSNTYQNASNALGLGVMDSPIVSKAAGAIPFVGRVLGPGVEGLKETARAGKAAKLAGLLSDSNDAARAIESLLGPDRFQAQGLLGPALLRAAPVMAVESR
jgi:hypothetical protein